MGTLQRDHIIPCIKEAFISTNRMARSTTRHLSVYLNDDECTGIAPNSLSDWPSHFCQLVG